MLSVTKLHFGFDLAQTKIKTPVKHDQTLSEHGALTKQHNTALKPTYIFQFSALFPLNICDIL